MKLLKRTYLATAAIGSMALFASAALASPAVDSVNNAMLDTIRASAATTPPPRAARAISMVGIAMFDAVNASSGLAYQPYSYTGPAVSGLSQDAVALASGYTMMANLFPTLAADLTTQMQAKLATLSLSDTQRAASVAFGQSIANNLFAARASDGSATAQVPYVAGSSLGSFQPTQPTNPTLPNWGKVTPFGVASSSQFDVGPPPAIGSAEWLASYNQVKTLGCSTCGTVDQKTIATFWADGGGTFTPPGHWLSITTGLTKDLTTLEAARATAIVGASVADAGITAWQTKYTYNAWRPITAIRACTTATCGAEGDPTWTPFLATPNFPSYTSGHSTFSGGAAGALASFFGTDQMLFCTPADPKSGLTGQRCFASFSEAAAEAGISRIYGGIHFEFDDSRAILAGEQIGAYIEANYFGLARAGAYTGYDGIISGTSGLTIVADAEILGGVNSYTGRTVIYSGASLSLRGAGSIAASSGVTANGTFDISATSAGARITSLSGTGNVVLGSQQLTLTNASESFAGVISGAGSLALEQGTLTLAGVNSYTGRTAISSGAALSLQGSGSIAASSGVTANGTFDISATSAGARITSLSGTGRVELGSQRLTLTNASESFTGVVAGAGSLGLEQGTLTLGSANSYAGGTIVNGGTVRIANSAAFGTGTVNFAGGTSLVAGTTGLALANGIVTRGTLAIDSGAGASTFTLGGAVSGSGGIAKQGTGVLTMAGASSYTGATSVLAGTLNVTGSLASAVTVTAGAAATGNGRVASLSVLAGATINPGAPGSTDVATLTVAGAATLAGTFTADVTSLGNDRITAGGALTLGGALVVNRSAQASFLTFNQVYTLASGATRSGSFATVSGLGNFGIAFAPVVEYGATQASLRLAPNSLVAIGTQFGGLNGNALETARAIDGAVAAGYNPQPLFAVYATAGAAMPRTLAEMSGEQRATERRVVLDSNRVFRETALDRLNQGTTAFGSQQVKTGAVTVWLRGAAAGTRADTSGAATAFKTAQLGVLTGVDFARNNVTIGAAFHYTTTDVTFRVLGGSSRVETVGATAYAGWRQADKGVVINAGASVSGARTSGNRAVTLTGFGQTLNGNALGTTYQLFAELAYDLAKSGNTRIEPFVRGSTITADMGASVESGGSAALSSPSQHYHLAVVNAGVRVATAVDGGAISLNASASVQSTSGSRDAATLLGLSGTGQYGNIRSVAMDPTALQIQAGTAFRLSGKARLGVDYVGLYGRNNNDYGARATLDVAF